MIIIQIAILIASVLPLILPLRVNFWIDVDLQFVARIKIKFIFTFEREKNLLSQSKASQDKLKLMDKQLIKTMLEIVYIENMTTKLTLDGNDISSNIQIISAFKIISDAISNYINVRFNGNMTSYGDISLGQENSLSIEGFVWFNILTISVIFINILLNILKSKLSKSRRKI